MALYPQARGGMARVVKPKTPRAPRPRAPKPPSLDQQARQSAMGAFRTALAQLQSSTPPVDQNAIYQPYRASEQVAGQLGTGLRDALLQTGSQAQQQAGDAHALAQQHAAQFGISAGAGAAPTAIPDAFSQPLAQQTQAYASSAPQAAAQWQQLLERSAAAKVSDAQLARAQGLTSAEQSLSGTIPGAIQAEKQLGFQQRTEKFNEGLAQSQLSQKQVNDLRDYLLGAGKLKLQGQQAAVTSGQRQSTIDETKRHNRATEKGATIRAQRAAASGVKGMPQVLSALKITSGSTTKGMKPVIGHMVTFPSDPNGAVAGAPALTTYVPAGKTPTPPTGYLAPANQGKPVLGQAPTSTTTGGMTRAQWNQAVGIYQRYNKVSRAEAMRAVKQITPRPPK